MRPIDADALCAKNAPTVDAEPVRHGHWITKEEAEERDKIWLWGSCSVCGAKMDGERGERKDNEETKTN